MQTGLDGLYDDGFIGSGSRRLYRELEKPARFQPSAEAIESGRIIGGS
jgi:hypothetical protein